jgi:hypothetical protein
MAKDSPLKSPLNNAGFEKQYALATKRGAARRRDRPLATAVRFDAARGIMIHLNNGCLVCVPLQLMPDLAGASSNDLKQVEILGAGQAIEWPTLDQQFDLLQLLTDTVGAKGIASQPVQRNGRAKARSKSTMRVTGRNASQPLKRG